MRDVVTVNLNLNIEPFIDLPQPNFVCVKVCDHKDVLSAVKVAVEACEQIDDDFGTVCLFFDKWEDIEELPTSETLYFDKDGESTTEDEWLELGSGYSETFWCYSGNTELEKYLGDNAPMNLYMIYYPDKEFIDHIFKSIINQFTGVHNKIVEQVEGMNFR